MGCTGGDGGGVYVPPPTHYYPSSAADGPSTSVVSSGPLPYNTKSVTAAYGQCFYLLKLKILFLRLNYFITSSFFSFKFLMFFHLNFSI
jgi:hypothetical protein